jgi:hypothetical protein
MHGTSGGIPRLAQIPLNVRLTVHRDSLAGESREVDALHAAAEGDFEAAVHQRFLVQALGHPRLLQQIDRALLQQAGANPRLDIGARTLLEHHRVDALPVQ